MSPIRALLSAALISSATLAAAGPDISELPVRIACPLAASQDRAAGSVILHLSYVYDAGGAVYHSMGISPLVLSFDADGNAVEDGSINCGGRSLQELAVPN